MQPSHLDPLPRPATVPAAEDTSVLAWVQDELRRSLELAHQALRRMLHETDSTQALPEDEGDPALPRTARQFLHQGVGALELVGIPEAAAVLRASEAAVQRGTVSGRRLDHDAVEAIERASFAVLDFVTRQVNGRGASAMSLFPAYRAVAEAADLDRVHPADLWRMSFSWRDIGAGAAEAVPPRARPAGEDSRRRFEALLLLVLKGDSRPAYQRLSDLCAELGEGTQSAPAATLWRLAGGFFEAQSRGLLAGDVYTKRIGSRLLAQLRGLERGQMNVSERLGHDLLFFCHQAAASSGANSPRLAAVLSAYGLGEAAPAVPYLSSTLGRFDPSWLAQARKRVAAAKDSWSAVAGGDLLRAPALAEQFLLVGDSLRRLYPRGGLLAEALQQVASRSVASAQVPSPAVAMEVATALLYIDASLEDGELDHPDLADRVEHLAKRVMNAATGWESGPLLPWMEELYSRVSSRQTMGSVVQELRASLAEVEKGIDENYRDPSRRTTLLGVPARLGAMRGVLAVLGIESADLALVDMRDDVEQLIATSAQVAAAAADNANGASGDGPEAAAQAARFARLAGNLGALSFLIDLLSVQPQAAKTLFAYDPQSRTLQAVGGANRANALAGLGAERHRTPDVVAQAQALAGAAQSNEVPLDVLARGLDQLSSTAQTDERSGLAVTVSKAKAALADARANQGHPESTTGEPDDARERIADALNDFVNSATAPLVDELPRDAAPEPSGRAAPLGDPVAGSASTLLSRDDEMLGIFLEEARDVLGEIEAAQMQLVSAPEDVSLTTTIRRGFHTLKGSSRMVGLREFGEAAWICEQVFNTHLAEHRPADDSLLAFTAYAGGHLAPWVDAVAARADKPFQAAPLQWAAEALKSGRPMPDAWPGALPALGAGVHEKPLPDLEAAADGAKPQSDDGSAGVTALQAAVSDFGLPIDLPTAADLDLGAAPGAVALDGLGPPSVGPDPTPPVLTEVEDTTTQPISALSTAPLLTEVMPTEVMPVAQAQAQELVELPPLDAASDEAAAHSGAVSDTAEASVTAEANELLDEYKRVGPLSVPLPLFNIFLNEADELSRRLSVETAAWQHELHRPVGEATVALAHSLAGSSATVGYRELSALARQLEFAMARSQALGQGQAAEAALFAEAADEIRALLHQFAAGFLQAPRPELVEALAAIEAVLSQRMSAQLTPAEPEAAAAVAVAPQVSTELPTRRMDVVPLDEDLDAVDALDAELFEVFEEEASELLPRLAEHLRDWRAVPTSLAPAKAALRELHTFKGGARLAGAMRLGEMAHRLEADIEAVLSRHVAAGDVEVLEARADGLLQGLDALRQQGASSAAEPEHAHAGPSTGIVDAEPSATERLAETADFSTAQVIPLVAAAPLAAEAPAMAQAAAEALDPMAGVDWARFVQDDANLQAEPGADGPARSLLQGVSTVRVRTPVLERMVGLAGEVGITRSRIESGVQGMRGSLADLSDNLSRLRDHQRAIEVQAESQMASRREAQRASSLSFDPLEFDRFTRLQELTRMMAEAVSDVSTVHRNLQRSVEATEDELALQARLSRDLQDSLLRTRMVEFEGLSERLYRVVRQAAKETGKLVSLEILGGAIEMDRGVLDRMTPAFEHLLRNAVTHGVELPARRAELGKPDVGRIVVTVHQEGNDVSVEVRDDGAGLDLQSIRERALAMGLMDAADEPGEDALQKLIFVPGFSTAPSVTGLAGRGIGMDVVRSEVDALGGRVQIDSKAGQGTAFKLMLPLTTAVTQVVMLRCGEDLIAVPASLVEIVRRVDASDVEQAYAAGTLAMGEQAPSFFWLGSLLNLSPVSRETAAGRRRPVVIVRSAQQRVALHVDEVLGAQEVVVKNLGPQLSRLPGLGGMTLLASGAIALIYNPVALATAYGERARSATLAARGGQGAGPLVSMGTQAAAMAPLVLVVDDSLTVRRVTQRLLQREGYRVALAKDGLEALERLAQERPAVVLSDIEMPRMDGFDLVRNLRGDDALRGLPVIMITSRIAQKHRDYAAQLGVDHYLGKPYGEDDLLALVGRYARVMAA